jgi:hypothetical protein
MEDSAAPKHTGHANTLVLPLTTRAASVEKTSLSADADLMEQGEVATAGLFFI